MVKFPTHGRVGEFRCGPTRSSIHETTHQKKFRIAALSVSTLRKRSSSEVVETMSRRSMDLYCLREIRWHGASERMIEGKDFRYKKFWVGNDNGTIGVGILLSEDINKVSDRMMMIKLAIDNMIVRYCHVMLLKYGWTT